MAVCCTVLVLYRDDGIGRNMSDWASNLIHLQRRLLSRAYKIVYHNSNYPGVQVSLALRFTPGRQRENQTKSNSEPLQTGLAWYDVGGSWVSKVPYNASERRLRRTDGGTSLAVCSLQYLNCLGQTATPP